MDVVVGLFMLLCYAMLGTISVLAWDSLSHLLFTLALHP